MDVRSGLRVVSLRSQTLAASLERDLPKRSFCVEVGYSRIVCRTQASAQRPDRLDIGVGDYAAFDIEGNGLEFVVILRASVRERCPLGRAEWRCGLTREA